MQWLQPQASSSLLCTFCIQKLHPACQSCLNELLELWWMEVGWWQLESHQIVPGYHVLLLSEGLHATMIMCVLVILLQCQVWVPVIVMDSTFVLLSSLMLAFAHVKVVVLKSVNGLISQQWENKTKDQGKHYQYLVVTDENKLGRLKCCSWFACFNRGSWHRKSKKERQGLEKACKIWTLMRNLNLNYKMLLNEIWYHGHHLKTKT